VTRAARAADFNPDWKPPDVILIPLPLRLVTQSNVRFGSISGHFAALSATSRLMHRANLQINVAGPRKDRPPSQSLQQPPYWAAKQ
jgi:hypothetical protein